MKNIAQDLPPTEKHGTAGRNYEHKRLGTVLLLAGIDLFMGKVIPRSAIHIKVLALSNG